ncbi:PhoPQ-activated pathogenicity-related protein [Nitrobacteraceae bacterium AZCC 1564]
MTLANPRPLNIIRVFAHMADCSTPGSAFTAAPCRGRVVKMGSVIHAAVTTADNTITTKIKGNVVTGGGWTIAFTGSAAGDVDIVVPADGNAVNEDDAIEFVTDGAGSGTVPTTFFADVQIA